MWNPTSWFERKAEVQAVVQKRLELHILLNNSTYNMQKDSPWSVITKWLLEISHVII
jgi:hypothetical protein